MLLPTQLSQMKLGCSAAGPISYHAISDQLITAPLPDFSKYAWGRPMAAARVKGHNDQYGDCVFVAGCNAINNFQALSKQPTFVSEELPLTLYETVGGFNPLDPSTDKGIAAEDFFSYWLKTQIAGVGLKSIQRLDPKNENQIRHVIKTQGGVFLVVNLSQAQQNQRLWVPDSTAYGQPGTWGLHAIWADQFDGALTWATSWGEGTPIDQSFFASTDNYVVEAYALTLAA